MKKRMFSIFLIAALCLNVSGIAALGSETDNPFHGTWVMESVTKNGEDISAETLLGCDSLSAEVYENGFLILHFSDGNCVSVTPVYNDRKMTVHYTAFNHDMIWTAVLTGDNTVTAIYDVYSMILIRDSGDRAYRITNGTDTETVDSVDGVNDNTGISEDRYHPPEEAPDLTGNEDQIQEPLRDLRSSPEFEAMDSEERAQAVTDLLIQSAEKGCTCVSGAEIDVESISSEGDSVRFYDYYGIEYRIPLFERDPETAGAGANTAANMLHTVSSSSVYPSGIDAADADVLVLYGFSNPDKTNENYVGYRSIAKNLGAQGINTEFKGQATVEDFKHLEGHKIIWICEHGNCSSAPWFEVNEDVNALNFFKYYGDLTTIPAGTALATSILNPLTPGAGIIAAETQAAFFGGNRIFISIGILHSKYAIKTEFFEHYYGDNKLDGTYVMIGACHSYGPGSSSSGTANSALADTLINCGAEAVTTWYHATELRHEVRIAQTIFGQLISGVTLKDAVAKARQWRGGTYSEMVEKRKYVERSDEQSEVQKFRKAIEEFATHELHLTPENSDFRLSDGNLTKQQMIRALLPGEEQMVGGYHSCFDYKGHACCEFIYYNFTWREAEELCESLGGHLLRLDEGDREDFINNSGFANAHLNLWIDDRIENRVFWEGIIPHGDVELKTLTDKSELADPSGFICEWDTTWEQLFSDEEPESAAPTSSQIPSTATVPDDTESLLADEPEEPSGLNNSFADVEDKLHGLWIRDNSMRSLYYFDNGKVTFYIRKDPSAPATDLHYIKQETQGYQIDLLDADDGDGYKIIFDNGLEYWLLNEFPDGLARWWYEGGELHYSGSSSYHREENLSLDDLILDSDSDGFMVPGTLN